LDAILNVCEKIVVYINVGYKMRMKMLLAVVATLATLAIGIGIVIYVWHMNAKIELAKAEKYAVVNANSAAPNKSVGNMEVVIIEIAKMTTAIITSVLVFTLLIYTIVRSGPNYNYNYRPMIRPTWLSPTRPTWLKRYPHRELTPTTTTGDEPTRTNSDTQTIPPSVPIRSQMTYPIVLANTWWTRESAKASPHELFIFGENDLDYGTNYRQTSTQAVIRGLRNAVGVRTCSAPGVGYVDGDFDANSKKIFDDLARVKRRYDEGEYNNMVMSSQGLGTGVASLHISAPKTFTYLKEELATGFVFSGEPAMWLK
jgi:hypothetical protein